MVNQLKAQTMNNLSKTITREAYLTPPQIETIEVVVEAGFTYSEIEKIFSGNVLRVYRDCLL